MQTYDGHYLAVYSIKWNTYHPRIFLSCSADWTIKMWDKDIVRPLMNFDMGNAVGDIEWAPYSSTVFSAVTQSGLIYLWDLNEDKHKDLCNHPAMKKANALHVAFNHSDPLILVGDSRGGVNSFKLSNALCKGPEVYKPTKEEDEKKEEDKNFPTSLELEVAKMERFLLSLDKQVY
jgi:dynein intermediate chain 1